MSESPIGALLTEATAKAQKKVGGHTALATDCSCEVEVVFFSTASRRERMSRCTEHQHPARTSPTAAKKRRVTE